MNLPRLPLRREIGFALIALNLAACSGGGTAVTPTSGVTTARKLPSPGVDSCTSTITADFKRFAIPAGRTIWFSAVLEAQGLHHDSAVTVKATNATISFTARRKRYSVSVPNSSIIFEPNARGAEVSYQRPLRSKNGPRSWSETVPTGVFGHVLVAAVEFPVSHDLPRGIQNITWQSSFATNQKHGLKLQWAWSAAVYTQFNKHYEQLGVKAADANMRPYRNDDTAGTPENYKTYVTGSGGSNYAGNLSETRAVKPCELTALTVTISPAASPVPLRQDIGFDQTIQIDLSAKAHGGIIWTDYSAVGVKDVRWPDDRTDEWHICNPVNSCSSLNSSNLVNTTSTTPNCSNPPNGKYYYKGTNHGSQDNDGRFFTPDTNSGSSYIGFMESALSIGAVIHLSANYGSNWNCDGEGDPNEAADLALICYNYNHALCPTETVGTEIYNCEKNSIAQGGDCLDLYGKPGDPDNYADNFLVFNDAIHKKVPSEKVCLLMDPQDAGHEVSGYNTDWETAVVDELSSDRPGFIPDCIEIEYYAENQQSDLNDSELMGSLATGFTSQNLVAEKLACSRFLGLLSQPPCAIPVYLDQVGSVGSSPTHQTQSDVSSVFQGEVTEEAEQDAMISWMTWHTGFGTGCKEDPPSFPSPRPYGFQHYGDASAFSTADTSCQHYADDPYGDERANAFGFLLTEMSIQPGQPTLNANSSDATSVTAWS